MPLAASPRSWASSPAAADSYRKAIAAAPAESPEAAEYELAWRGSPGGRPKPGVFGCRRQQLLALLVIGVQPPTPEELALEEANKLADEVLARKDIEQVPAAQGTGPGRQGTVDTGAQLLRPGFAAAPQPRVDGRAEVHR